MINTIIIDDNIKYIEYLMNNIISKLEDIRVTHIVTQGKDFLDIIKNNDADLVLLDLKMPNINGIEIIEKMKNMDLIKFPNIIVISGEIDYIYCVRNEEIISDVIEKNNSDIIIKDKIENTISNINYFKNDNDVKKKIIDELLNLGYNFKYKGTKYLFDVILYIYKSNDFEILNSLENNVYRIMANKYNKSINNIKTNIIKATRLLTNKKYEKENITPKIVINNILIKIMYY